MSSPIHEALREVRGLQARILQKQRFKGYSGRARALGGCVALLGALVLESLDDPETHTILGVWLAVLLVSATLNYGALLFWFLRDSTTGRNPHRLRPALEVLPTFLAGAFITIGLVAHGQTELIYGVWMLLYGLAQWASRRVLPRGVTLVGIWYFIAGALGLFLPGMGLHEPVFMGLVFFIGEWMGGFIFHFDEGRNPSLASFFGLPRGSDRS